MTCKVKWISDRQIYYLEGSRVFSSFPRFLKPFCLESPGSPLHVLNLSCYSGRCGVGPRCSSVTGLWDDSDKDR